MVRYALDIDGVVAGYRKGIRDLTEQLGIRPLSQPLGLEPEALDALMEERQQAINQTLHDYIKDNLEEFWGGLDCIVRPGDYLAIRRAAAQGHELFWVSQRPSLGKMAGVVTDITLRWLQSHQLPADAAHVFLGPKKSVILAEHSIQYHLDDMVPQATEIALNSQAKVYLLRCEWNRHIVFLHPDGPPGHDFEASAFGIPEVDHIEEYITIITGAGLETGGA